MSEPILFYYDYASPYAYFAFDEIERIGIEFGRPVVLRPVLLWAIIKAHGIAAPLDVPAKRDYFLRDMERSAAFLGLPYRPPVKLPLSTHLAARLHYAVCETRPDAAMPLARRLLRAFFVEHLDISDETTLIAIAGEAGIDRDVATEAMKGPSGRALLERAVAEAIAAQVVGSPYMRVDGEGFFGADRLPQLRWCLSRRKG